MCFYVPREVIFCTMKRLNYYISGNKRFLLRFFAVIILIIPSVFLRAGEKDFNITVRNITQTASNKLEFDVYILDTDPSQNFYYATSQLGFLLNSNIYEGGKITVSIENRNPDFTPAFVAKPKVENKLNGYPGKTLIKLDRVVVKIWGQGMIISKDSPGSLMTHFIITADIDFAVNTTPDITFTASTASSPLYPTKVFTYIRRFISELEVNPGVNAIVYGNPVLNQMNPPKPFEVIGSGSYCEGEDGLPVGLTGSEEGVRYTLFRNGIPQAPVIIGTGKEISFDVQKTGEYTVTGRNRVGETAMKGSAKITEIPLPKEPVVSVDCSLGAGKAIVRITNLVHDVYEYRLDKSEFQKFPVFTDVVNGNHTVTIRNTFGCTFTGDTFLVECACINPPVIVLSSYSGITCGTEVVTIKNNRFGGGATSVTITENGSGNIIPVSTNTTPFDFVYFPAESDIGKTVLITVTTNNPDGAPCEAASATYTLMVSALPSVPVPGTITQPTLSLSTGSVVINGLPSRGTWRLTRSPGNVVITGTGTTTTVSSLPPGIYTFTVTNNMGCISPPSSAVIINPQPKLPELVVNNPPTICSTGTADLTLPGITAGSDPGLTFTYWYDDEATIPFATPDMAPEGTYYIKGTSTDGFFTIKPVIVLADEMPIADSGPDLTLGLAFETKLNAMPPEFGNGMWTVLTGGCRIIDIYDPKSTVRELSMGQNILLWKVKNGVCPEAVDSLVITVKEFTVPSLLTPNMDGKNDYFKVMGLETLGKTELVIFDRRGARVYQNNDYKNDWNGVDHKGNFLPEDTYFYILKSESGKNLNGFVVLRK